MASTYIYRDATSAVAVQKATISFWVKKCGQGTSQYCFFGGKTGDYSSYSFYFKFHTDDTIKIVGASGGSTLDYKTTAVYRDPAAWYHIVIKLDMTETGTDRVKLYINGVFETNYSTQTAMTGTEFYTGKTGYRQFIGYAPSEDTYSSVCLSHYQYIDGAALAPTEFGETDATSGIWKIKTSCYGTPGTNGFCLKMEDRTNLDLDSSSNALTMTTSGTGTATYDNPSNNFCTLSNLSHEANQTMTNGNNTTTWSDATLHVQGTMGMQGGKYYWEIEINENNGEYGVCENGRAYQRAPTTNYPFYFATNPGTTTTTVYNNQRTGSNSSTFTGTSHENGDVVMMAYDADNGNLYYGKNGTWENSGDPTSGATATGAIVTSIQERWGGMIVPFQGSATTSSRTWEYNFGNGYFGTTSHGETNSDSASIGLFKYTVPSGYYALCTKNIKSQGGI